MDDYIFNRVLGLKFLYDNFPYYFNKNRLQLFFVNSKKDLNSLEIKNENFDTIVLKRSADPNKAFYSDLKFKDNRFFPCLNDLKEGAKEFEDIFNFCVECHKFKKGENYYSDRLAIAQFNTYIVDDNFDRINFIPSIVPGVNTRDNSAYLAINFPYDFGNIFKVQKFDEKQIKKNFSDYEIAYLAKKIHNMIDDLRNFLLENNIFNSFQLIIRIDSYLNLLPIDFRTTEAWAKIKR